MVTRQNTPIDPLQALESLRGWGALGQLVQTSIRHSTASLADALATERKSKLAIGANLIELRKILEPKRMFVAFLKEAFHMSVPTAYRYIENYQQTSKVLPKAVLAEAVAGNFAAVSRVEVVAKNPPPVTTDRAQIVQYLQRLEDEPTQRANGLDHATPDDLLKECLTFVANRWQRVPGNARSKANWMRSLIGMLLTRFGVASAQSFSPVAIPDGFRVERGRPRAA